MQAKSNTSGLRIKQSVVLSMVSQLQLKKRCSLVSMAVFLNSLVALLTMLLSALNQLIF